MEQLSVDFQVLPAKLEDANAIRRLQELNHQDSIEDAQKASKGFLTVVTSIDLIEDFIKKNQFLVIKDNQKIIAYIFWILPHEYACAGMTQKLHEMVQNDEVIWQEEPIKSQAYFFIGQVCIDATYRGKNILQKMYVEAGKSAIKQGYSIGLAGIRDENKRSLHVHGQKLGFTKTNDFELNNKNWQLLIIDFKNFKS